MEEFKDFMKYLTITAKNPNKLYAVVNKTTNEIQKLTNKKCFMEICDSNFELRKVNRLLEVSILTKELVNDGYAEQNKSLMTFTLNFDLDKCMRNAFVNAEFYRIGYKKNLLDDPNNRSEVRLFPSTVLTFISDVYYVITDKDLGEVIAIPNCIKAKKLAVKQKKEDDENMRKIFNTFIRPNMKSAIEDMLADPDNKDIAEDLNYLSDTLGYQVSSLYIDSNILKKIYTNALYNFLTDKFGKCGLKFDKSKLNIGQTPYLVLNINTSGAISFDIH